jgi:hypothetical protein
MCRTKHHDTVTEQWPQTDAPIEIYTVKILNFAIQDNFQLDYILDGGTNWATGLTLITMVKVAMDRVLETLLSIETTSRHHSECI